MARLLHSLFVAFILVLNIRAEELPGLIRVEWIDFIDLFENVVERTHATRYDDDGSAAYRVQPLEIVETVRLRAGPGDATHPDVFPKVGGMISVIVTNFNLDLDNNAELADVFEFDLINSPATSNSIVWRPRHSYYVTIQQTLDQLIPYYVRTTGTFEEGYAEWFATNTIAPFWNKTDYLRHLGIANDDNDWRNSVLTNQTRITFETFLDLARATFLLTRTSEAGLWEIHAASNDCSKLVQMISVDTTARSINEIVDHVSNYQYNPDDIEVGSPCLPDLFFEYQNTELFARTLEASISHYRLRQSGLWVGDFYEFTNSAGGLINVAGWVTDTEIDYGTAEAGRPFYSESTDRVPPSFAWSYAVTNCDSGSGLISIYEKEDAASFEREGVWYAGAEDNQDLFIIGTNLGGGFCRLVEWEDGSAVQDECFINGLWILEGSYDVGDSFWPFFTSCSFSNQLSTLPLHDALLDAAGVPEAEMSDWFVVADGRWRGVGYAFLGDVLYDRPPTMVIEWGFSTKGEPEYALPVTN